MFWLVTFVVSLISSYSSAHGEFLNWLDGCGRSDRNVAQYIGLLKKEISNVKLLDELSRKPIIMVAFLGHTDATKTT